MRITKWGEYAILFCIYLAKRESDMSPAGATEIGNTYNIPTQYAQQILHRLRKGNIIKSIRGPHGGFRLLKNPEDTNLKEILYAAEGDTFEVICDSNTNGCTRMGSTCSLKFVWQDLKSSVDTLLEGITLTALVEKQREIQKSRDGKLVAAPKRAAVDSQDALESILSDTGG